MKQIAAQLTIAQLRKIASVADSAATSRGWQKEYPDIDTYKVPPQQAAADADPLITRGDKWQPSARLLHIHNYWHRYIAALMALFAFTIALISLYGTLGSGSSLATIFVCSFIAAIIGLPVWGFLALFRSKIQDASNIHKIGSKSLVFKLGAALGLAFYLYTNGIPSLVLPEEFTRQHIRVIVLGTIKLAAEIYGGGKLLELLAYRFLGLDPYQENVDEDDGWINAAS